MKILKHRGETLTLATTVGYSQVLGIPPGMNLLEIEVPSATKENISLAFTPKIEECWFYDDSAATKYIDLLAALTDRNASVTSGNNLNEMQTADFLYVGADMRFRGIAVDIVNGNSLGTAAGLVTYWNGSAWVTITPTDGTFSTRTLAQDGLITWTVPTAWARTTISRNGDTSRSLYWVRYAVDAALTDTSVSIAQLTSLLNTIVSADATSYEGNDYVLLQSNAQSLPPYRYFFNSQRFGGIEMKSASITSAANINWYQCAGGY